MATSEANYRDLLKDDNIAQSDSDWGNPSKIDIECKCITRQLRASLCHILARGAMNLNFLETARLDQEDSRHEYQLAWNYLAQLIGSDPCDVPSSPRGTAQ